MQSRVRFNRVPKKVPEKVWEAPGEGSREGLGEEPVRFRRKFREALAQSRVRFNTVPEKVPEKQPEAASGQVIPKIPGEGLGGFGAKPSQARQTGEGSEEVLVQSQVKFNGVPDKAWEVFVHSQVRFNRVSEKVPKKVEPDLALHQSLPDLRNFPESCLI